MIDRQQKIDKARELFLEGYNCAQAVAAAFAPEMQLDEKLVLRMSAAFGGGIGGQRLICGAVNGMNMVLSYITGYDEADDMDTKKTLYANVRRMAAMFTEQHETMVCRDLLIQSGIRAKEEPSERTPEYYRTRPCVRYVEACAGIVADILNEN